MSWIAPSTVKSDSSIKERSRGGGIRTHGLQHPMLARYQATLHPETAGNSTAWFFLTGCKCTKILKRSEFFKKTAAFIINLLWNLTCCAGSTFLLAWWLDRDIHLKYSVLPPGMPDTDNLKVNPGKKACLKPKIFAGFFHGVLESLCSLWRNALLLCWMGAFVFIWTSIPEDIRCVYIYGYEPGFSGMRICAEGRRSASSAGSHKEVSIERRPLDWNWSYETVAWCF